NGWIKNKEIGFKWLNISVKNSEFGALVLGMFYEYNFDLDLALRAYKVSMGKGSYYAKELYHNLQQWNQDHSELYKTGAKIYFNRTHQNCINSCLSEKNSNKEECEDEVCNYYIDEMHNELMNYRRSFDKALKKIHKNR
ncbi:MAG: hypothetical protein HRT73_14285, partial [Flavobacteriales bacterium]|nr:hypothetical protein [Flavobacteriales bacterium]